MEAPSLAQLFFGRLANLFRARRAERRAGRPPRLRFQSLEPRILLSADILGDAPFVDPTLRFDAALNGAADEYTLRLNSASGDLEILNGSEVVASQALAATRAVVINGEDGQDDNLTIDFAFGGVFSLEDGILYNGGTGGIDKLTVQGGQFASITHTFTQTGPGLSGNIAYDDGVHAPLTIAYTGLEPIDMTGSTATSLVFNLPGTGDIVNLEDASGAGTSQLRSGNGTFETTTFSNTATSVTINMGSGEDLMTVSSLPDYHGALTINGNAGTSDAVIFSGTSSFSSLAVTVAGTIGDAPASLTVTGNASFNGSAVTLGDNAGDVTNFGTLTFNSAGAVSISEDSDTVLTGSSTAGSLALISTGAIGDLAATQITATGNASFTATSGGIGLADNAGDVLSIGGLAAFTGPLTIGSLGATNFGSLIFNTTGTASIFEDSDTVLAAAGTSTAANLFLTSSGAITDGPGAHLTVGSTASLLGSSVSLTDGSSDIFSVTGVASFVATGGSVSIDSAGSANFGSLTVSALGASISEDSGTQFTGNSTVGSNGLSLTSTGAITDATGAHVTVAGSATFSGTSISLTDTAGDVLSVGAAASFAAASNGAIIIGAPGSANFGALSFSATGTGAVTITEDSDTNLAASSAANGLTLVSAGSITDAAGTGVTVIGNANFSGSAITLGDSATDTTNFDSLTFNSVGAVSISEDSDTLLIGTSTANSLSLISAAQIGDLSASVTVAGNASLSGTSISLLDSPTEVLSVGNIATLTATSGLMTIAPAGTANFGALTFNATGSATIFERSDTVLTGTSVASALTLNSTGSITDAAGASVTVTATANLAATAITLGDSPADTTNFGKLTFNSAGAVSVSEDSFMVVTATNTAGSISLTAAGFLNSEAGIKLAVAGDASLTGASINFGGSPIDTTNFGTLRFNSAGGVAVIEKSDMVLAGSSTAGILFLNPTGSITDLPGTSLVVSGGANFQSSFVNLADASSDVLTAGNTSFAASGPITIGAPGAVNFGTLQFHSGDTVSINEDSDLFLTGANTAGSLSLGAAGSIQDASGTSLSVSGAADFSGTSITLGDSAGDTTNFSSLTFSSPGAVSIAEDSDLFLAGNNIAASVDLTSPGGLVVGGSLDTGKGSISLAAGSVVSVVSGGTLNVDVGGTGASDYTHIAVSGGVTLDGTLNAELVDGFAPAGGDRFRFMTFGSRSGFFANANLPADFSIDQSDPIDLELVFTQVDTIAPEVTIDQAPGQFDPADKAPVQFVVHFSEEVTGFDASDISFAGSTVGGTLAASVSGIGADYSVSVSGMLGSGAVVASIAADAAADLNGNSSHASTSTDNSVFFIDHAPTVSIEQAAGQEDPTDDGPISFTVFFSEAVTGFGAEDILFGGSTTGGILTASVTGSGALYSVAVSGMEHAGVVVASVSGSAATDAAGQFNDASVSDDNTVTFSPRLLSIGNATSIEGNNLDVRDQIFTVALSAPSTETVRVDYRTQDDTATGNFSDYFSQAGTLVFNPGETSKQIAVAIIGDTTYEPNESYFVILSNPVNAAVATGQGIGTIIDDDTAPSISIGNAAVVAEGNTGTTQSSFFVFLSNASTQTVTVDYATADGTATAGSDYVAQAWTPATPTTLTFAPGEQAKQIFVTVNGDTLDEPDELFFVNLFNATNSTIFAGQAYGTITDDDPTPTISLSPASVLEGAAGTKTSAALFVELSAPSAQTITVDFSTSDGTATAFTDYGPASGTLTFEAGSTGKFIFVGVNGDDVDEPDETFFVSLSSAVNAAIVTVVATNTILDDDSTPTLSVGDVTVTEGDAFTTDALFTVTLSNPSSETVFVDFRTVDGTARWFGGDYSEVIGSLTFAPGETSKQANVFVIGDLYDEPDETFSFVLSNAFNATIADGTGVGTILNDDPPPSLSISDASMQEWSGGTTDLVFTVTLSKPSLNDVLFDFSTADLTALAGSDYAATSGTIGVRAGQTVATVSVPVLGDIQVEPDEQFLLRLSNPTNAVIADGEAIGTILNDDFNSAPAANPDSFSVNEDGTLTVSAPGVLGNDTDADNNSLIATLVTGTTNGSLTFNADGSFTYTPNSNFNGTDSFTYKANDGLVDSDVATVTVSVNSVNDAPHLVVPLDIVTANEGSNTVGVLHSDGAGGFGPAVVYTTGGTGPGSIALGDVNGDGELDIVTANIQSGTVAVLTGNGAGGYSAAVTFASGGSNPLGVALGDVNGDGKLDIVVANLGSGNVGVLAGDGVGGFAPAATFASGGSNPVWVALGDVNGDGKLDIVTTNQASNTVGVLAGNGAGGFTTAATFTSGGLLPFSVTLGDVNGDGKLDIVTVNQRSPNVGVLAGDGLGGFALAGTFGTGGFNPLGAALGDVNGDGNPDIVVANISGTVGVLAGNGLGGFAPAATFFTGGAGPVGVALADVNGDGKLDIVAANQSGGSVSVLVGDGAGNFTLAATYSVGGSGPLSLTLSNTHYTENQTATVVNGGVRITDVDSTTLSGATVSITGNFHAGQDVLGFLDTANITGSYDAASGVLTLSGTDTLAAYQAALRSVTYLNSSEDPSADTRAISYQVDDGAAANHLSNIATAAVTVTPVHDAQPTISVSDVTRAEGNVLETDFVFNVSLSTASSQTVTVDFATANGTATGGDYFTRSGTLSFAPGETSKQVTVFVHGENIYELPEETFFLNLSNPVNAAIADGQGQGTILDDDPLPTVSVTAGAALESDPAGVSYTISLSNPSAFSMEFVLRTVDGTASAGSDYAAIPPTVIFWPAMAGQGTDFVALTNDALDEVDETFQIVISDITGGTIGNGIATATILDDDAAPSVSITGATVTEGNSGTVNAVFEVALSGASGQAVTVDFRTFDGTALAGSDYQATSGTLTFAPGETNKQILVAVNGDTVDEDEERFSVVLLNPVDASLDIASGRGRIIDDDATPVANPDTFSVDEDNTLTVSAPGVLGNDIDDSPSLTATLVSTTTNGSLTFKSDGSFTYAPNSNFNGTDGFTYQASDGTNNSGATTVTLAVNAVAPTVSIDQAAGQPDPTITGPIQFAAHFSEAITGFTGSDISFAGSTVGGTLMAAVSGSGADYTVQVSGMVGTGVVVASIPAGAALDLGGSSSFASTSTDNTVTFIDLAPTVTIDQAAGQPDPTQASPIEFTVHFSEAITGFTGSDISFAGTTVGGTLTAAVSGSGADYTVHVNGMASTGVVVASIGAGAVFDAAGQANFASTSTDNTISFIDPRPTATIDQAAGQPDPAAGGPIQFTAHFSEAITGFTGSDISFAGTTVGGTLTATVSGSGTDYTVQVSGMLGTGIVVASIGAGAVQDLDGNGNFASTSTDNTVTFIDAAPTVTIDQAAGQPDPATSGPIQFTVHFSEAITGFTASDISFAGTTVGGTLVAAVSGSGADYTVLVSGMTSSGVVVASVAAGAAQDAAGQASFASTSADNTVAFSAPQQQHGPDLVGTVQWKPDDPLRPGDHEKVKVVVTNIGDVATKDGVKVKLYASKDGVLDASDILLDTGELNAKLKPGQSGNVNFSLELPDSLKSGHYVLLAVVDAGNKIKETNEANNVALGAEFDFRQGHHGHGNGHDHDHHGHDHGHGCFVDWDDHGWSPSASWHGKKAANFVDYLVKGFRK